MRLQPCLVLLFAAAAACEGYKPVPIPSGVPVAQASAAKAAAPGLLGDGEACAAGGDCQSGMCKTFYRDADGDGYGTTSETVGRCSASAPPSGYAASAGDCCDLASDDATKAAAAKVHPGADWQARSAGVCGITWDYDCDGKVTTRDEFPSGCKAGASPCETAWARVSSDRCGQVADFDGYDCRECRGPVKDSTICGLKRVPCPVTEQGARFECR